MAISNPTETKELFYAEVIARKVAHVEIGKKPVEKRTYQNAPTCSICGKLMKVSLYRCFECS